MEELLQERSEEEVSGRYCNTYQRYCLNQVDPVDPVDPGGCVRYM